MKNKLQNTFGCFFLVILMLLPVRRVYAQSEDFATWTGVKVSHKVAPRWSLSAATEFRSKDHLKKADRVSLNLGASCDVLSFLKISGIYELHYRNRGSDGWKFRHRYLIGPQASVKGGYFKFSLREYFQQTISEGEAESRLRSRIKAEYVPTSWTLHPYFSAELYQPIGGDAFFSIARMRYRPGINVRISQKCSCDVFYCRQYEPVRSINIVGLEFLVRF